MRFFKTTNRRLPLYFKLDELPIDILDIVTTYIASKDILSLRLTCRSLAESTVHSFCRQYFRKIETDLSPASLAALETLGSHTVIAPRIRELNFISRRRVKMYDQRPDVRFGEGHSWPRDPDLNHIIDVQSHSAFTRLSKLLRFAFTSCRIFTLTMDGIEWWYDEDMITTSDVILLICFLTNEAHISLESIRIQPALTTDTRSLDPVRFSSPLLPPSLQQRTFSSITDLQLEFTLTNSTFDWTAAAILSCNSLRSLSLGLGGTDLQYDKTSCLLDKIRQIDHPPALQEFALARADLSKSCLLEFLMCSQRRLKVLSICCVRLGTFGDWKDVLETINTNFGGLQQISLAHLLEFWAGTKTQDRGEGISSIPGDLMHDRSPARQIEWDQFGEDTRDNYTFAPLCDIGPWIDVAARHGIRPCRSGKPSDDVVIDVFTQAPRMLLGEVPPEERPIIGVHCNSGNRARAISLIASNVHQRDDLTYF